MPLVLLVGVATVSTAATMIRFAGDPPNNVPSMAIAAWRVGLAALLLLPVTLAAAVRGRAQLPRLDRPRSLLAILSGVLLALHFAAWITSLSLTSVASSVALVTTTPIWVAIGGALLLHERPSRPQLVGILVATAGAGALSLIDAGAEGGGRHPGGEALVGDLLAVVGALGASGYFLIGRRLRASIPVATYAQVVYAVGGVSLVAAALVVPAPLLGHPPAAYLWLVLLALGPQLVGHTSLNWVLRYLTPSAVAAVVLAEPIGSMVLAYAFLRESITPAKAVGAAAILAGIYVVAREEGRAGSRDQAGLGG